MHPGNQSRRVMLYALYILSSLLLKSTICISQLQHNEQQKIPGAYMVEGCKSNAFHKKHQLAHDDHRPNQLNKAPLLI